MPRNLLISYDLYQPGQNYEDVATRIKSLGTAVKVHKSFWYVRSDRAPRGAADHIWKAMDGNDTLFVADAKTNDAAWYNLPDRVSQLLQENWA
jgi:hypothetical protein